MNENIGQRQKDNNQNNGSTKLSIFKDSHFIYLYNKTEKIVTALYMITNFMSVNEPLKWQIREVSLKFLDAVMSFNKTSLSNREIVTREASGYLFQTKSLFSVAYKSGFISNMNFDIIEKELTNLAQFLAEYDATKMSVESPLFNKTFFDESLPKGHLLNMQKNEITIKDKYQYRPQNVIQGQSQIKDKVVTNQNTDRRAKILDILNSKNEVSIKDIAMVIVDCSEKTLQRELLAMVSDGLIIKEGERRWSKYSLRK